MIRRIALVDLHLLTYDVTGAEHNFELLKPEMLELCHPFLYSYGVDVTKQIAIQVCKSRSISKGVHVGYSVVGWSRLDKEWRNDPRSTLHLHSSSKDWKQALFDPLDSALEHDKIPISVSDIEPDFVEVTEQMQVLTDILRHVRGNSDVVF